MAMLLAVMLIVVTLLICGLQKFNFSSGYSLPQNTAQLDYFIFFKSNLEVEDAHSHTLLISVQLQVKLLVVAFVRQVTASFKCS